MLKRTSIRRLLLMSYIPSYRNGFPLASARTLDGFPTEGGTPS